MNYVPMVITATLLVCTVPFECASHATVMAMLIQTQLVIVIALRANA